MPAAPAATSALDADAALARLDLLRSLLDQTSDRDGVILGLMRCEFACLDAHYEALARAQAARSEWTAALRQLASHRRMTS
jgi:hypothetical protein